MHRPKAVNGKPRTHAMKRPRNKADIISAIPDLLEALEALALDLRNAANGHGIGNLDTLASLAENALTKAGYEITTKHAPTP
jgi:hypothetical protein